MQCPFCERDSQVVDSRTAGDGGVRRRRICNHCKRRFTTYERVGSPSLKVIKRSGRNEPFDSDKLLRALRRVCRRRPGVKKRDVERVARAIEAQLIDSGLKSVKSGQIAELALARLQELDRISYERLAANYLDEDGVLRTDPPRPPPPEDEQQLGLFRSEETKP